MAHGVGAGCLTVLGASLAVVLCWSSAVLVLQRQARPLPLLGWTLAAQALSHLALSVTCKDVLSGREGVGAHLATSLNAQLLAAHALLAVWTAWHLSRADAGLWAAQGLLRALRRLRRCWLGTPQVVPSTPALALLLRPSAEARPVRLLDSRLPVRRGPPTALA